MSGSLTTSQAAVAGGIVGASMMMFTILIIAWWVLLIIARWKIFTKAGEAGWKSIIPIYADYIQWKIAWKKTGLFWVMLLLAIAGSVLASAGGVYVVDAYGNVVATGASGGFLGIAGMLCILAACVLSLMAAYKLFASFGRGVGWFIGYIFVSNIMMLILAFGSSQYYGPQE